jgi:hypothetical protein
MQCPRAYSPCLESAPPGRRPVRPAAASPAPHARRDAPAPMLPLGCSRSASSGPMLPHWRSGFDAPVCEAPSAWLPVPMRPSSSRPCGPASMRPSREGPQEGRREKAVAREPWRCARPEAPVPMPGRDPQSRRARRDAPPVPDPPVPRRFGEACVAREGGGGPAPRTTGRADAADGNKAVKPRFTSRSPERAASSGRSGRVTGAARCPEAEPEGAGVIEQTGRPARAAPPCAVDAVRGGGRP